MSAENFASEQRRHSQHWAAKSHEIELVMRRLLRTICEESAYDQRRKVQQASCCDLGKIYVLLVRPNFLLFCVCIFLYSIGDL
jgi:hypothetical protein